MTTLRRPLLSTADRNRMRSAAAHAETHADPATGSPNRAYARGVADVLRWLSDNADPSPMLAEVTR
jgi:hypothetical protein